MSILESNRTSKSQFWAGVRAEFPLLVGVFPFGMIYGILALDAGLEQAASQAMSSIIFAGSSQFITTQLVAKHTPGVIIILTIIIVNLRHLLYSASLAPYLQSLPTRWKLFLSYLLTDEAYAASILHYKRTGGTPTSHWFLFGAGISLWTTWQISTAVGVFLGRTIPGDWPLDFALPLTFIAIVVPMLTNRAHLGAALTAGVIALAVYQLPYQVGLMLAAMAGITVGFVLEHKS